MSLPGVNGKGPHDQKILNEELIGGIVEVARHQPQHAAELFGIGLGLAVRLAGLGDEQVDDLATTPVALWRPRLVAADIHRLAERRPLAAPALEAYRPVIERINRLALATMVRHTADPYAAALICGITDPALAQALQDLPAFALVEWGGNPGGPLIAPRLSEPLVDRLLRGESEAVEPELRGLLAFQEADDAEFERLQAAIRADAVPARATEGARAPKRSGRPAANFLMPATSDLILTMLRHQMRPSEVEDRMLATTDVRAVQLRGISESLNPRPKRPKGAPRDRSRDHRDLWGSAQRRMTATAIFRLQRRLVDAGIEPFEAIVRAYDYYVSTYDRQCGVSLSRLLRDVYSALRRPDSDTRLCHCPKCGVVHLSHDEKAGIIECPVCVLARAGRVGARRTRALRGDPATEHAHPASPGWSASTHWAVAGSMPTSPWPA